MCGLGLILRVGGGSIPDAWLDELDRSVAVRGPDASGRHRDALPAGRGGPAVAVALVHRRLAVIDPDGGGQPMVRGTADDQVALVFNGYVPAHRAIRTELERDGARFDTWHSDTEAICRLLARDGAEAADRLDGMYAIAAWDRGRRCVHLLRDPFGEKPLWIARRRRGDDRLLVASSHPAAVAMVARAFDAEAPGSSHCDESWPEHDWSPAPASADVGGASPIDPATWLHRYFALGYGHPLAAGGVVAVPPSLPPAIESRVRKGGDGPDLDPSRTDAAVDAAIGLAVERRLESDVPLGCFLSGGLDSTLVAAHAHRRLGQLDTFTVRMPDPRHDESVAAAAAAKAIGTRHHVLDADADAAADLEHLIEAAGLPFADSSILPAHWVSRAARRSVTVCLGGDGGDELFGGYVRYRGADLLARWRFLLSLVPSGVGASAGMHPRGLARRLGRLGTMARDCSSEGLMTMERVVSRRHEASLLRETSLASAPWPWVRAADGGGDALRALDLRHYLPGDLMTKMDVASMAVGLEVRSPMLDLEVASLAAGIRLPRGGPTKARLRRLARPILGAAADRPKQGFAIPLDDWIRSDFAGLGTRISDAIGSSDPFGGLPIDRDDARRIRDEHLARDGDHGAVLFSLLTLSMWAARWPALARVD